MADVKVGDSIVGEAVPAEVLNEILKGYNRPELELVNVEGKQGTSAGDNYMSIMTQLKIQLRNKNTGSNEILQVMHKTLPKNEFRAKMVEGGQMFVREVCMYEKILPAMEDFQRDAGLTEEDITTPWPKSYACTTDGKNDYLVMEDLRSKGYSMVNRKLGMDMDHCKLVMSTLAKFHATSYAMFQGDFDKILEKYPVLEETVFSTGKVPDAIKGFMQHTYNQQASMLKDEGEEKGATFLEKILSDENYFKEMKTLFGGKVPWAVIGHGDCWTNNYLFRYDEKTNKPIEVKFVDFQISKASSRCVDIHYFLYTSPKPELLNDKEEELEQHYFDEFTKFAKRLGVDTDEHELTKENFKKEIEKFRYYGATTGLLLATITSADAGDVPEIKTMNAEGAKDLVKEAAMKKVRNIAVNHLPKCEQLKK